MIKPSGDCNCHMCNVQMNTKINKVWVFFTDDEKDIPKGICESCAPKIYMFVNQKFRWSYARGG